MRISKQIKQKYESLFSRDGLLFEIEYRLSKLYSNILRPFRYIKTLYQWHKNVLIKDWDFDALGMYRLLEYKLKRVRPLLIDGVSESDPKAVKALDIVLKILDRIEKDIHEDRYIGWHDRKWGKMKTESIPIDGGKYYSLKMSRDNAITPEEKEQERKEFLAFWDKAANWRLRDKKIMFDIIIKYDMYWWD